MTTYVPDDRDRVGVEVLLLKIKAHDGPVKIACFSKLEAMWIRAQLEGRGVDPDRLWMSWLEFPVAA